MRFSDSQLSFLKRKYIARIATVSKHEPHISPIYFTFDRVSIFFVTEPKTMKFRDIVENPLASIVVDEFDAGWLHGKDGLRTNEKAVVILGRATIIENKRLHKRVSSTFKERYPDFQADGYPTTTTPIIRVMANRIWEHHYP
jgi:nitroimidazol reductase NimA-like FMN-containing flavoprotein (pyridoxamine 5'-phosphate oxidase superfamily)